MTNRDLIEKLIADGALRTPEIITAFRAVDRLDFVPKRYQEDAYKDHVLPIGYGQTISQPSTVAFMFELLQPKAGQRILDIGSGSGWTTALLALIVGSSGRVTGVELVNELVEFGNGNLAKYNFDWAEIRSATPNVLGFPGGGLCHRILVSASADEYPNVLENQLAVGGRMVMPVGTSIILAEKKESGTQISGFSGFVFVPLK